MSSPCSSPDTLSSSSISPTSKRELYEHYGIRFVLTFISHRVIRSGPKLLLYLAILVFSLSLITKMLPLDLPDSIYSSTSHLWRFRPGANSGKMSPEPPINPNNEQDALVGGGLRIVVFGENDEATSSLQPIPGVELGANGDITWTQVLCSELHCSTYLSFVPKLDSPRQSLTSNSRYDSTVKKIVDQSTTQTPANNFSFVSTVYPPRWEAPDLSAQVSAFLNQSRPARPPMETVWVFSFGRWDVWSLAAYPVAEAKEMISLLVEDIFSNVNRLYEASQDRQSIAYSDYDTKPVARTSVNSSASQSSSSDKSPLPWDDAQSQPFRVLIPQLLDPSVVPAWHMDRPDAPPLHTKSEQLRNAVSLTRQWNDAILFQMEAWVKENDRKPEAEGEGEGQEANNERDASPRKTPGPVPPNISSKTKRAAENHREKVRREAVIFRPADYIMDVIIDGQLRARDIVDRKGFGMFQDNEAYVDVDTPCLSFGAATTDDVAATATADATTDNQADPIDAADAAAAAAAGAGPTEARRSMPPTARLCESPDDHLFFTPFSLGRRAIEEVGRFSAAVMRGNRSDRASWESNRRSVRDADRTPRAWRTYMG